MEQAVQLTPSQLQALANTIAQTLQGGVDQITSILWALATALAAVGILSMAIIEIYKATWNPRRRWQKHWFEKRVRAKAAAAGRDAQRALTDLKKLATAGDELALYDLPIERFTGQINSALQLALEYPTNYADALAVMSDGADGGDIARLAQNPPDPNNADEVRAYGDARKRIAAFCQRNLDAIQIEFGSKWERRLQKIAVVISTLIILVSVWFVPLPAGSKGGGWLAIWPIIAVLGGMVAPVAYNVVSALRNVKERAQ